MSPPTPEEPCAVVFGKPSNNALECRDLNPAEAFENGLNAVVDELRIYDDRLSANEVQALFID